MFKMLTDDRNFRKNVAADKKVYLEKNGFKVS